MRYKNELPTIKTKRFKKIDKKFEENKGDKATESIEDGTIRNDEIRER